MKKISTLFKKDPNDLSRVINEVDPQNEWALTEGIPTRKYDGTAAAIINGDIYKRYDVKKGKAVPDGAIPCQEPDEITGHWPHWVKCERDKPEDKWFWVAFDSFDIIQDGTYELCGPKVQGNPEGLNGHILIKHGVEVLPIVSEDRTFEKLKYVLLHVNIEGIVFHHPDGRMCKIRKSDFGIKRI